MPEFDFLREINLSEAEIKSLPDLLDNLSINESIRDSTPPAQSDRFRRTSCFPGIISLEALRERFKEEIEKPGDYSFLEKEQAVLSQALILGISVDGAGDNPDLSSNAMKALLRKIHSRAGGGAEKN